MHTLSMKILCLAFILMSGCTTDKIPELASKALAEADVVEFYSLSPDRLEKPENDEEKNKRFQNWAVLGKTTLDAEETREPVLTAFIQGVNENEGIAAACFNPRHGLRAKFDDKLYDFVICFECLQVQWFIDGVKQDGFLITESPAPTFNKILTDAGVPLPPKQ